VVINGPISIAPPTMFFSHDGRTLAAYSEPNTLALWDTASGKKLTSMPLPERNPIQSGAFSLDGRCLALDMNDGTVALWELATGKERRVLGKKIPPATGLNNGMVMVNYVGPTMITGTKVAFSPDGKRLVHAGLDRAIRVWDATTGAEIASFPGHTGIINAVAFAPGGKRLASASSDTTVLIWDLSTAAPKPLPTHTLPAADAEARWAMLQSNDAQQAFAAICDLTAAPQQAAALLRDQLKPAPAIDMALVEKLIAQLDDPTYKVRQKATGELLKLGERVVPAIDKTLAAGTPLETKKRLEDVRDRLTSFVFTDEKLRLYRAIEVLEQIGTPEARQVLQSLAEGAPGAFSTTTAQAALARSSGQ
jgi:hypothetical protein